MVKGPIYKSVYRKALFTFQLCLTDAAKDMRATQMELLMACWSNSTAEIRKDFLQK
jgi:hypothetical protein